MFYISKNNVDWIFKSKFGPLSEKKYESKYKQNRGLSLEAGLDKLSAFLTGTKFSAEGTIGSTKSTTEEKVIKESVEDRALMLINNFFPYCGVEDVENTIEHENESNLYKFCLPLNISETFNPRGSGTLIKVSYQSDHLCFCGITSCENWISQSILNTFLLEGSFKASGIFVPLSMTKDNNFVKLTVQYLLLGYPGILW